MPDGPSSPTRLGDLERVVMETLWAHERGTLTVRAVHNELAADRDIAYTTVLTVLDRLAKKGMVLRERVGRSWEYRAAASRAELTAASMRHTMEDVDSGDRRAALMHFLDGASTDEVADLRAALAEVERRANPDA
ncbi:BlaI/MecI/CopY family transcriptional regulator [Ornithinimicrobium sp. Arc0846-15]|nr:BlaI/MecI/CopY family transcriptional regulator [Ornithinimicrobium laminariae]